MAFRQAAAGFGEALAALGRNGPDAHEIRRGDALGARVAWAEDHHWLDAALVPVGAAPPADDPALPHCLWAEAGVPVEGRTELPELAMPVMTLDLTGWPEPGEPVERVAIAEIGAVNDRAYGGDQLGRLIAALPPDAGYAYGVRAPDGRLASAAASLDLGSDTSVQWVATDPEHRRQGLGTRVMRRLLHAARGRGRATASLQASPDGLPLYERLGFRTVGELRPHVR